AAGRRANAREDTSEKEQKNRGAARPGKMAEAADDHRHEAERQDVDATAKVDGRDRGRHDAADRGERKTDREGEDVDATCRNTHRHRRIAVMAHSPHPGSKSRLMQENEKPDKRNDGHGRREDPVDLVVDTEEVNRALDRRQDAARRWAKGNANAFLKNERQAESRDDR